VIDTDMRSRHKLLAGKHSVVAAHGSGIWNQFVQCDSFDFSVVENAEWNILLPASERYQMTDKNKEEPEKPRPRSPGDDAEADINASIYKELRRIASAKMRLERGNHTLQPTALVHEAYLRLAGQPESAWRDRSRILGLAASAMRHILVDHARAHSSGKRGAGAVQVTLDEGLAASSNGLADVLAVDQALIRLAEFDPRQARVLELHFFAGLTFDEIATELGVSVRTIKSDWAVARAWLHQQMTT
jgi:RNA polymerase sigma-70 factor, ECF subfamily